jgi:lipopolysaccharide biosynthesis glycosyltransferase
MFVTFLNKWRVIPFTQICLNLINQNKIKKIYEGGTQSVMNLVFRNIFSIPQEWNQTGLGELPNKNYYKPDFENSIKKSKILHWTGKYKPWLNPINNEDFSIYWYKYT